MSVTPLLRTNKLVRGDPYSGSEHAYGAAGCCT